MTVGDFAQIVTDALPYKPNEQQRLVIAALARFCSSQTPSDSVFLLNGYAGTGKTSLTGALVKALTAVRIPVVLLAPTGRAAKVFSIHARHPAFTIHRKIYRGDSMSITGASAMLQDNRLTNAVFIVDEASMIGNSNVDSAGNPTTGLLEDLLQYVFTGTNCRLILIGDIAQLPPVGSTVSPAMDVNTLKQHGLRVSRAVMTDTARQARNSGILRNATWLRRAMLVNPLPAPRLMASRFSDVDVIDNDGVLEVVYEAYNGDDDTSGPDNTIIITRSNRRATAFNLAIRQEILDCEEELIKGERLLVAKNNYMWARKVEGLDFIANGDVAVVDRIIGTETRYGCRFADVTLTLPDREISIDCKIILDTLTGESASLETERYQRLAEGRLMDPEAFDPAMPMEARVRRLKDDEYFNALQVKYAYAVTCHKAQGAQWANVIIDMGGIAPDALGLDFYRWLYTATSRATSRLYYLNPTLPVE